jgi:predicted transcriptional regulator
VAVCWQGLRIAVNSYPMSALSALKTPPDVMKLITSARLALFRTVKEMPGSITDIAERLHRDRSAVKRDVDELERAGLVTIADKVLPGHGRMKEVRATANRFTSRPRLPRRR